MKLLFVRHGESQATILRVVSNRGFQHPLTEKGRQQALLLAQALAGEGIRRIYSSPLMRAVQTAEILSHELDVPYQTTDALREFDCGVIEGRGDEEAWKMHGSLGEAWLVRGEYDQRIEGGESFNDIRDRFVPFIEQLVLENRDDSGGFALVGHGGTYICMLPLVLANVDHAFAARQSLGHTAFIIVEPRPEGLVCLQWGDVKLADDG